MPRKSDEGRNPTPAEKFVFPDGGTRTSTWTSHRSTPNWGFTRVKEEQMGNMESMDQVDVHDVEDNANYIYWADIQVPQHEALPEGLQPRMTIRDVHNKQCTYTVRVTFLGDQRGRVVAAVNNPFNEVPKDRCAELLLAKKNEEIEAQLLIFSSPIHVAVSNSSRVWKSKILYEVPAGALLKLTQWIDTFVLPSRNKLFWNIHHGGVFLRHPCVHRFILHQYIIPY